MPTNSADPQQLTGFADLVRPRSENVRAALPRLAWALASYRANCSEFPIDESTTRIVDAAVDALHDLLGGTRRIAAAFAHADERSGSGPDGVRWASDAELTALLEEVVRVEGGVPFDTGLQIEHDTSWSLTADGLEAGITGSILYGARVSKEGTLDLGPVKSTTRITGTAGVTAEGSASFSAGKDGVRASADAELFAGVKADVENTTSFGPCQVTTKGTASAGLGVEASADAEFSRDRVAAKFELLTTLGVGAGGSVDASCEVPDGEDVLLWASDVEQWADDTVMWVDEHTANAADWVGNRLDDLPWVSR